MATQQIDGARPEESLEVPEESSSSSIVENQSMVEEEPANLTTSTIDSAMETNPVAASVSSIESQMETNDPPNIVEESSKNDEINSSDTKVNDTNMNEHSELANETTHEIASSEMNSTMNTPETTTSPVIETIPSTESSTNSNKRKRVDENELNPIVSRDEMAKKEEDFGLLEFTVITNDGTPDRMIQLMTLKNIFSKQLPKMPKEYIVRLVFDRNHHSMVILKNKKTVVGGICYRPFLPNHFGEIAFCAITASEQVKGYGTRLMNHLKEYVKTQGITHFLTYADNYAIGYFKKQGFSKIVSMPKSNWFGYIKDYDGGTLMECLIHQKLNYLEITSMVQIQRQMVLDEIRKRSRATIVYRGLTEFCDSRMVNIHNVPGVKEAGWNQTLIRNNRTNRDVISLKQQLQSLWKSFNNHRSAWPFHEPVDVNVVTDYLDIVKNPIDLSMIQKKIDENIYTSKAGFKDDIVLMCENCLIYNSSETNYYKAAKDLQEFIKKKFSTEDHVR